MSIRDIFPIDKWDFKSGSILTDLPQEEYAHLMANHEDRLYKKGEVIFREGSYSSGIFYIREGKVKKYKTGNAGKEHILYVANTGELIGYHALLAEDRYPDSAAALEESQVIFIPKEDFIATIHRSPIITNRLLKTLSHEFAVLINSVTIFAQQSVRERLALQLIILREKYKVNFHPGQPVEINMGREDLASLTGTSRENVVRILTEFKEEGILVTKGRKIIISNVNALISIANYR